MADRVTVIPTPNFGDSIYFAIALATLILSAARLTRLVVADDFPPSIWLRIRWDTWTKDGHWSKLVHCPWCLGPWLTLLVGLWAYLSNLHWTWWAFNGWLALSYVVSWVVFHDEDPHGDL